jgi:hypothetical protein
MRWPTRTLRQEVAQRGIALDQTDEAVMTEPPSIVGSNRFGTAPMRAVHFPIERRRVPAFVPLPNIAMAARRVILINQSPKPVRCFQVDQSVARLQTSRDQKLSASVGRFT